MATYNVESWLRHKSVYYKKGETIAADLLTPKQQAQLVKRGVISRSADYTDLGVSTAADESLKNESVEEILDLNFTLDELKDGAKEADLEFKSNISKANLIGLIIKSGKQNHFLDQLEDEEDEEII